MADAQGNRYGPYDIEVDGSEAEALTEDAWFDLFGGISGVKSGGELTFNGLTANLAPIDMRVHGSYLIRADPWSDASPATPAGGSPRLDMLVARRQLTSGEGAAAVAGETFLTVLRGTPAATPAEPTDYDPNNDEPLWSWQVPGNAGTAITAIRDLRKWLHPDGRPRPIASGRTSGVDGHRITAGSSGSLPPAGVVTLPPLQPGRQFTIRQRTRFYAEGPIQSVRLDLVVTGASRVAGEFGSAVSASQLFADVVTEQTFEVTSPARVTFRGSYSAGLAASDIILKREDWTAWL